MGSPLGSLVSGGEGAEVGPPDSTAWKINVSAGGNAAVNIALPTTLDCYAGVALATEGCKRPCSPPEMTARGPDG